MERKRSSATGIMYITISNTLKTCYFKLSILIRVEFQDTKMQYLQIPICQSFCYLSKTPFISQKLISDHVILLYMEHRTCSYSFPKIQTVDFRFKVPFRQNKHFHENHLDSTQNLQPQPAAEQDISLSALSIHL